jgi:hypothetical protein
MYNVLISMLSPSANSIFKKIRGQCSNAIVALRLNSTQITITQIDVKY